MKSTKLQFLGLIVLALALFGVMTLTVSPLLAQQETGAIAGTVTDPTGAVVPNAKVTVKGVATGSLRNTTTNTSGIYTIPSLQPADYQVTVEAPGFSAKQVAVNVAVGSRVGLDVQLEVGATGTTIEVAELSTSVNTETQTLGAVVNTQQVLELPSLNRDPYAFIATVGNVSANTPDGRGVGYAINGQRAASTNILLDGMANNDEFGAGRGQNVPLDSVQEFSVLTSNFTAEFGRATGGIVNVVTKSGTNAFHGSAWEFNRLSHLASNDFNSNANSEQKAVFTRNQFGYSVGGPVVKNRLFFFSSVEWTRIRSAANNTAFVPTQQLIAATAANTQNFMKTYGNIGSNVNVIGTVTRASLLTEGVDLCKGLPAGNVCSTVSSSLPLFNRVNYVIPSDSGGGTPQNSYSTVNRVDYNMSDKTQMYVRYALSNEADFPGSVSASPYDGFNTVNTQRNNSIVYSLTHSFTPSLISQSKVTFSRFNNQQPLSDKYGPVPTLYMGNAGVFGFPGGNIALPGFNPYSPGSGVPFGGPQNFVQLYEDFSWTKGKHQIRFGGDYSYLRDNRTFGAYETAGDYLGTTLPKAFENYLNGLLYGFTVAVDPQGKYPCGATKTPDCTLTFPVGQPNFSRSNRYNDYALYAQDAWKITSRVTLNLGLRWEVFGTQHNKNPKLDANYYLGTGSDLFHQIANGQDMPAPSSPIGKLWNTAYGNIGPRVGIAWDITGQGKTSLRAGYGIAYERNFNNVTFNVIQNPPNYASVSVTAPADFASIPISTANLGPLAGSSGSKALPKVTLRGVNPDIKTAYAHLLSAALEHKFTDGIMGAVEYSGSLGQDQYGIANVNRYGYGNYYLGTPCTPGTDGDPGNCTQRMRPTQYGSINFRTNGGTSRYNAMNLRMDVRAKWGLNLRANYTYSHAIDDLSDTFSSSVPNLGWLDPFHPSVDKGDAYFDIRHRLSMGGVWAVGNKQSRGLAKQVLDGWQFAPILTITSGAPFSIVDCTNGYNVCPYAFATKAVPVSGDGLVATSTPNNYQYMDMSKYFDSSWYDPKTGISDVGTFPSNMVGRNRFRGPGAWNLDMGIHKNFFVGDRFGLQLRAEGYNFFNHPNLQNPGYQDFSAGNLVTTSYTGRRFFQMALRMTF